MADQQHLYSGFSRSDKEWVTREIWADLALKEHIPALKELLSKMPPPDRAAIDRANELIKKRGRREDIVERLSWEKMSIESMERRLTELKREVAAIDDEYLVGGGREWPLTGGGAGGSEGGKRGEVGRGGGRERWRGKGGEGDGGEE